MAACGVLKPKEIKNGHVSKEVKENTLTESNSSMVSWEVGLLFREDSL